MIIKKLLKNEEITGKEVRLIDHDGVMLGITPITKALQLAVSLELDLVQIESNANPSVCKIMDYKKFIFEQAKKEKQTKKVISLKEIKIRPNIQDHDFEFKVNDILKFLENGDKVKVSVNFKGRELQYTSKGVEILNKISNMINNVGIVDKQPKLEGKSMTMILRSK